MNNRIHPVHAAVAAVALMLPPASPAQDAATLYRSKCASCHGAAGAGRAAIKGTNLLTNDAKKHTDDEIADWIANGGPKRNANHAYEKKGVTPEQVALLVQHVRDLQKKSK
jgi:mono/diheme cytochrome c family protein